MRDNSSHITNLIRTAEKKASKNSMGDTARGKRGSIEWPVHCTVGPGLEGAIACETKVGYVNGSEGRLIYRGYDIFDLCENSTFEEVTYLLLFGKLPSDKQKTRFKSKLFKYMYIPETTRLLSGFPVEDMDTMAALRFGISLLRIADIRNKKTDIYPDTSMIIATDEDSIPMETPPVGESHAIYEFDETAAGVNHSIAVRHRAERAETCCRLIAGVASLAAAIARIRAKHLPLEPIPELSHAGNLIYMMTGKKPTPVEERVMDVCLILHADHGMNASTFAALVVASTLADIYFSVGSGIGALSGQLHGGANQKAYAMLEEIGGPENVGAWCEKALAEKRKIMGVGHRVYKTHDPRALVLGPLAGFLARKNKDMAVLAETANVLEKRVCATLGAQKGLFPNVDFYSGLVYKSLGIPADLFTPIFATSRVSGWTARIMEYLESNRIFRPRAIYTGSFGKKTLKSKTAGF